jgi:hypothetical protein
VLALGAVLGSRPPRYAQDSPQEDPPAWPPLPLGLPPDAAPSLLLAALAALLAWTPLGPAVLAHARVASCAMALAIVAVLCTPPQAAPRGHTKRKSGAQRRDVRKAEAKQPLRVESREAVACVRDGMRRVDAFAEAGAKAQLTWDARQMKLVPAAAVMQRR